MGLEKDMVDINVTEIINNNTGNVRTNVTVRCVRATIVAAEK
jgi:hypothetical protein